MSSSRGMDTTLIFRSRYYTVIMRVMVGATCTSSTTEETTRAHRGEEHTTHPIPMRRRSGAHPEGRNAVRVHRCLKRHDICVMSDGARFFYWRS